MLLEIVRWMLGYVSFEIIGKFPERFINIVSKNSISIWNTSKRDQSLFACMHVKDYKNIRRLAKKSSVRLKVVSRHGFPFFIKKYHNRIGVVFGVIVFTVIVYVLSCFVWTIDVVGLETISYSNLMNTLNDNGLYVGTYIPSVSFNNISRSTMIEIDDIAWMAINVQGSHASVELKEKRKSPKVPDFNQPANVKAKCDGVILSINTRAGEAYFEKSSAVVKDQMLVSGVLKDKLGGVSVVRADAEIIARTNHKSTFSAEKTYGCYSFSNAKERKTLGVLGVSLPVKVYPIDESKSALRYDESALKLFDTYLPVTLSTERLYEKTVSKKIMNDNTAEKLLRNKSMLYELFSLNECKVIGREYNFLKKNNRYFLEAFYTCEEDIAYQQEIDVDNVKIEKIIPTEEKSQ